MQAEYPGYFAYLLAHEFGHASTVLTDLGLTIYEELLRISIHKVAPHRRWRWDELPHEILYDRFGIAIAEELFGRSALEREFASIIGRGLVGDVPRLENALNLGPTKDLSSLQQELALFAAPYKDDLLRFWQEHREAGRLLIADGLRSLDCLWLEGNMTPEKSEESPQQPAAESQDQNRIDEIRCEVCGRPGRELVGWPSTGVGSPTVRRCPEHLPEDDYS